MVVRNVRYAIRSLARAPGFALTIVLTLAIGIGANSAVFSALNAILLRPLPLPDADRLVALGQDRERVSLSNIGPARLEEWNARNSTFQAMTGYYTENVSDASGDLPEKIRQSTVAPRFVEVFGIAPVLGRGFGAADHEASATPAALISERYWQRRFKSDATVLGTTVPIGNGSFNVVGVLPASFTFPDRDVDIWVALRYQPYTLQRTSAWFRSFGRLKPGVTAAEAQADLDIIQAELGREFPKTDAQLKPDVQPLKEAVVGGARSSLWLLFAAVSVLLLIACTNIASLLLARAARREQEIGIRFSLGASRWAVAGQVLAEAAVLAVAGAALGLLVAAGASSALRIAAAGFPRIDELKVDAPLLLYTGASIVLVTLLCGAIPALRSAAGHRSARNGGRAQVSMRHTLQWSFVGVQVTLSVTLLCGAGLLLRSFQELGRVDPGFDPDRVLTFRVSGGYGENYAQLAKGVLAILDELRTVPGVDAAATSTPVPGVLNDRSGFEMGAFDYRLAEGRADDTPLHAANRVVSSSYFSTLRMPVLAGEVCKPPLTADEPTEVVVNRAFASRYLAGRSPLGLDMQVQSTGGAGVFRIVGVVGDARDFGLEHEPTPTVYSCSTASAYPALSFLLRTRGDPMAVVGSVRQRLKAVAPQRSVYDVQPLTERIGAEYAQDRLRTALLVIFAGAALSLVCLGIYGTLSYIVSLRRREVGLRVALGALRGAIVAQFVSQALRVVGVACALGLVLSLAFGRALSGLLYAVSPFDPLTLASVVVLVVGVAALAAFLPSLRASRIDPMEALSEE